MSSYKDTYLTYTRTQLEKEFEIVCRYCDLSESDLTRLEILIVLGVDYDKVFFNNMIIEGMKRGKYTSLRKFENYFNENHMSCILAMIDKIPLRGFTL